MINRFFYWDEWRKAYWEWIDNYPELFPFLHRMYVFQDMRETASTQQSYLAGFFKALRRDFDKICKRPNSLTEQHPRKTVPEANGCGYITNVNKVDILFDAFAPRDTCLGVGESLFRKLKEQNPDTICAFYQFDGRPVLPREKHMGCPVISLNAKLTTTAILRFLLLLPVIYWHGFRSWTVTRWLLIHPLAVAINLMKITMLSAAADQMLNVAQPSVIISCNEQGGADSSVLFAVARKKGLHTIQYLHAAPTRQFVPFISAEFWSWSDLTTHMLLGNSQDARVFNIGALEHDRLIDSMDDKDEKPDDVRVLFLSQVGMDEAWGISAVRDGIQILREGIRQFPGRVTVRVREHPNANDEKRMKLQSLLIDLPFDLSAKGSPLASDVKWATHVYSVCSNAIFAGLRGGKPSFLFWNDELDEIYGRCFLPDECILKSAAEMTDSLQTTLPKERAEYILQKVLGPPGAMKRAAQRIVQLVNSC